MSKLIVGFVAMTMAFAAQAKWTYYDYGSLRDDVVGWQINAELDADGNMILKALGGTSKTGETIDFEAVEADTGKQVVEIRQMKPTTLVGKVYLPHVKKLGPQTFFGCTGITEVDAPELVEIVGDTSGNNVFKNCTSLKKVSMPKVEIISDAAFYNCAALEDVGEFPNLISLPQNACRGTAIARFVAPKLEEMGQFQFYQSKTLTDVRLPSLKELSNQCFYQCWALTNLELSAVKTIPGSTFNGFSKLQRISIAGAETVGDSAFQNCSALADIGELTNLKTLGQNAFRGTAISRFEAPALETMGMYQFYQNKTITEVKLPALTNIAANCFYQCSALTNIELNSIVTLPANTFNQASGLKRLVLSDSIKDMPVGVFSNCTTPESIEPLFPKALESMGEGVYAGMRSLCSPVVFDCPNMTTIPAKTFQNCVLISNIVIKTPVTAIGDYAFQNIKPWASFTFHCDKPTLGTSWWTASNWEKIQGFLKIANKDCVDSWLTAEETTSKAQLYEQQKNSDEFNNPGERKTLGCFAFGNGAAWLMKDWPSGFMLLLR